MVEILFASCGPAVVTAENLAKVTARRRALIDSLVKAEDKAQSLTVELLLNKLLTEKGLPLEYAVDEFGKPQLPAGCGLHIGLSHCEGMAAVAISDVPVGIDVEKLRATGSGADRRVFSAAEQQYLQGLPQEKREAEFLRLWVCRESYAKALGQGLLSAIGDHISFINSPCEQNGVSVYQPQAPDGYVAAVATVGRSEMTRIRTVSYE